MAEWRILGVRVGTGSSGDRCPVNSGVRVLEAELTG